MRKAILLLTGAIVSLSSGAMAQAENPAVRAKTLYRQGLLAVEHGQVESAKQCFEEVLRLQPNNVHARYQLKNLEIRGKSLLGKKRQMQLKAITIPAVDFEDVTLKEALETLSALIEKKTEGKFVPNFVVQDPGNALEARKFTLKLGAVPASIVLQYSLDSAKATARYDEHAIVIRPIGGAKAPAGAPAPVKKKPAPAADPFG